jgi:NitT/TauT family transport system permease protein
VLAAGVAAWELWCAQRYPALRAAGPGAVFQDADQDWPVLSQSLLTTLTDHARRFCRRRDRRHRAGAVVQPVEMAGIFAVSLCGHPAGDAGDRDRAAALIYLPQQTAVIVCAWIVAFFPVLSNTTLGLNSVDRNLAGLFQLYGASRCRRCAI